MTDTLKRTPMWEDHRSAGAKMVSFAGYEMPVQYPSGILEEHRAVREAAGLFDVSHMGEFNVRGPDALALVQRVTTNDASRLEVGQAQYAVICAEDGGVIDDCIVYRFENRYMMVVNASNRQKDLEWVLSAARGMDVQIDDVSDDIALLALQGPRASAILADLTDSDLDAVHYYNFTNGSVAGARAVISRTGYTGEDGFELYVAAGDAPALWRRILESGRSEGVLPVGLGARDTLRLEMGYALYGNDLDDAHNPIEAGLGWVVKLDKGDFLGRDALARAKENGVREKLIGFTMKERGFPRHGYVVQHDGEPVGEVTSGVLSPSLQQGIGMAWVATEVAKAGTPIEIMIRDRPLAAEVSRPPFYKSGSIRR